MGDKGQQLGHSDLEVPQPGLEVDHARNAPQVVPVPDKTAPQVAPSTAPQVVDEPPIESFKSIDEKTSADTKQPELIHVPFWYKKAFWIAIGVAALVVIALGVGLGVGLGNARSGGSQSPTPTSTQPTQSQPGNSPATSVPAAPHSVSNGTSLASAVRLNGEKHVFFQDESGIIREAIAQNDSSWTSPSSYVVATDARENTPLAAFNIPAGLYSTVEALYLVYVSTNDTLSIQAIANQEWAPGPAVHFSNASSVTVNPSAKSLSVTFQQINVTSNYSVVIFYETSDGAYNAIYGVSTSDSALNWTDTGLEDIDLHGASIEGPVTLCASNPDSEEANSNGFAYAGILNGTRYSAMSLQSGESARSIIEGEATLNFSASTGYSTPVPKSFTESDLTCNYVFSPTYGSTGARYAFWVNGTTLQIFNSAAKSTPQYSFPYPRLSAVTPINSTQLFLYSHFNGSVLSEHMYDISTGHWTSSNISIEIT